MLGIINSYVFWHLSVIDIESVTTKDHKSNTSVEVLTVFTVITKILKY
jgi:hypothetical protein